MKRILSILLVLVLILSLSVCALAAEDYAMDDPYEISDAELAKFETAAVNQNLIVTFVICMIISLVICLIVKSKLRSVHTKDASDYTTEQGLNVRVQYDHFTHVTRHVTRVATRNKD